MVVPLNEDDPDADVFEYALIDEDGERRGTIRICNWRKYLDRRL